ncbi:MAG TPA: helix-turn-helix transcriptional regulator [Thermoleophilaceae bacterium]|jgi:transcriptional regulator with XRE-family HTH domain
MARPLSPEHKALGDAIRAHRERKLKISQEALADKCGLHRTYVSSVERGEANVGYRNLLRIADALEIKASELVRMAERRS